MLLLAGCVDDYVGTSKGQKDAEANPNDFSLQEAHEFFDKAMELAPMTRSGEQLRSDGVSFPTGEFNTQWKEGRKGQREQVVFYDFPIEPQMRYKARRMVKDAKGRSVSQEVRVYQRLMIAKDLRRQKRAVYIVTFIPDAKSSGKVRCEQFMRGKRNGHYSGVVLYLNPYTYRPVRVDRYENGVQTGGVFLAGDVKDAVSKVTYAQELLGDVQIAQRQLVAPMSFDENQGGDDFGGGGGGGWNWNDSDLTQTGDGEWTYHGHDAYGNEQDYTVIDTDGDGKPDSIFIDPNPPVDPDPGTEEPDPDWGWGDGEDGNGGDEWETTDPDDSSDGSKDPVDPNPGGGSGSGGGTTEPDDKPAILPTIKLSYPVAKYPGYVKGKFDCMQVCKSILNEMLGSWSEVQRYQLYKENGQSLQLVGDPKTAFEMMNESLEQNRPLLVGLDYKRGKSPNSDGTTDHFVVITGRGYDETKQQYYYNYIETGRSKNQANAAASNSNRLYYDEQKGTFTGEKWTKKETYNLFRLDL